jgi:hypothetical protein
MELTGSSNALFTTNTAWAAGRFGPGSLRFNGLMPQFGGSLAWVSNTAYGVLPPTGNAFSVSFWFCPDTLPTGSQSLAGNDADGSAGWDLALDSPGPGTNYLILTGTGIGTSLSVTGRTLLLPEQWRHVVVTCGNGQASIFLDDVLLAQTAGTLANNSGPLYFGGVSGVSGAFAGRIDEIRTYTNALSADALSLKGCWHLDENSGYLAYDSSLQGIVAGLSANSAWTSGKSGSGLDLAASSLFIPNQDYRVLPPSGIPFSVSFWLNPRSFRLGRSALLSCASGTNAGWQATLFSGGTNQQLEFTSTNFGGTLSLSVPVNLPIGTWSEIDLTFNGVMANAYINGRKVGNALGAIRAARAPLLVGSAQGASSADAIIDELRVYGRELADFELGPIAQPMWEMALLNSSTNLTLPASGPPGRLLAFSILSNPSRGTLTWSTNSPVVTYIAGAQKGPDTFVYNVSDGVFTSPPATAAVSVVQAHWLSTNGGTALPLDGSSPDHAWAASNSAAVDAIWHTNNYYDCFFYGPGEFQTTGWRWLQRGTANVGCKHIGSGPEGPNATTLQLVNTWNSSEEGVIFSGLSGPQTVDDFEVHNLLLDCNAQNNPKYAVGEPVSIRIPLTSTAYVQQVTLYWASNSIAGVPWNLGPAADFQLCSRVQSSGGILTNCTSFSSTGLVDVVDVQTNTDELTLWLTRKGVGVDFYALSELEVTGAQVSLPSAWTTNATVSRLDAAHSILNAVDQDPGTCWASGPEDQVTITLPLEQGTALTGLLLNWNCKTMTDLHRLGPAAQFSVLARDPGTGQDVSVPFVSHGRLANGSELITFGTSQTTNTIVTAQVTLFLIAKVAGVDYYCLSEISFFNGDYPVAMRLPSASRSLAWNANYPVFNLFDSDPTTLWANSTQGSVSAVQISGSNLKFSDLKIINFGTKASCECFVVFVGPASVAPPARNVLMENCIITQPATNNTDGCSAVSLLGPPGSLQNGVVRNCVVDGLGPVFFYSHGFVAPLVEGCVVKDVQVACYFEPDRSAIDALEPALFRSNVFINVSSGISVFSHPVARCNTIIAIGNDISVVPGGYGAAGCDTCFPGTNGTITNVAALGNVIHYSDWNPRPTDSGGGFFYTDIHHAIYANNIIALGTPNALRVRSYPAGTIPGQATPEDCDHPGLTNPGPPGTPPSVDPLLPGYRRAWLNNRDLTGSLLPVRYTSFGVDGPASQQQWSEELP